MSVMVKLMRKVTVQHGTRFSSSRFSPDLSREADDARDVRRDLVRRPGPEPAGLRPRHRLRHPAADRVVSDRQHPGGADGPEGHHQGDAAHAHILSPAFNLKRFTSEVMTVSLSAR